MEEVLRRTSLVILAFPCFVLRLRGVETEAVLDYQAGRGSFPVEPSPGHIRCRNKNIEWRVLTDVPTSFVVHLPKPATSKAPVGHSPKNQ